MELKKILSQSSYVLNCYEYGSVVYKTNNEKSDKDYILIVENHDDAQNLEYLKTYGDFNIFDKKEFESMLDLQEVTALECIFIDKEHILKHTMDFIYEKKLPLLRASISTKSSNSWVKAKKKLTVEKDYNPYIGKKSAWHALRILDFGTQIAKHGKIINYTQVNDLLPQIMICTTWEEIDKNFRSIYNKMSSDFKLLAPKEIINTSKTKP